MQKVAVLIDNMYLHIVALAFGVNSVDIKLFSDSLLEKDEELFKTYVFDALPYLPEKSTEEQKRRKYKKNRYLERLRYLDRVVVEVGYVKLVNVKCKECSKEFIVPVQKAVDVMLSVRLVSLAWSNAVDIIALVTGDGDFLPAVNAVSESNTVVRLFYAKTPKGGISNALLKACTETREIHKALLESCKFEKSK